MLDSIISEGRLAFMRGTAARPRESALMAQALPLAPTARRATSVADPARAEHRRRIAGASLLVLGLFQAAVGLAWDIRWHGTVGRDDFWTLPHLMIYSGVALAGLVALCMVLFTSARYWRGDPALDDTNTITVFGVFHAPLGFVIAGFGLATMLLAAPGDNYWHQLYGIDVALWAPFHLMGLLGGGIAGLGTIHAIAAEVARARARGWLRPRLLGYSGLEWLTLFAISGLLSGMLTTVQPAAGQFPTMELGPVRFLTYPPLLALAVALLGVACVRLTGRPGAATAMAGLYVARQLALGLFVPWAIQMAVAQQGLEYRTPGLEPRFSLFQLAVAASFLVPALAIDLVALLARRGHPRFPAGGKPVLARARGAALAGLAAAVPLFALGTWLTFYIMQHARTLGFPPEIVVPPAPPASTVWLALPLTLFAGAGAGALGSGLGAVLRLNER